jgi:hypothetical protein
MWPVGYAMLLIVEVDGTYTNYCALRCWNEQEYLENAPLGLHGVCAV